MSVSNLSRRAAAAAIGTIAAIALSACSASSNDDVVDLGTANVGATAPATAPSQGGAAQQQSAVVPVSAFEHGYQLVAPVAAGTYTFELTNIGEMEHDLVIEGEGASGATQIVGPGEGDSFTVDLEPGTYTLYCSVGTHRAQGMEFTFDVA